MESEADSNNDLRVASFSVYLNSAQEDFVHKHGVPVQNLPPSSIVFPLSEETPALMNLGQITTSGEIGVLGAEKYHNISTDDDIVRKTTRNHAVPYCNDTISMFGTPSVNSKASMNSKTVLLRKAKGSKQNNVIGKSLFSGFSCKNFCADKKSICVGKNTKGKGKSCQDVRKGNIKMEDSVMADDKEENKAKIQVINEFSMQDFGKVDVGTNRSRGHFAAPVHRNGVQNASVGVKQDGFTSNEEEDSARSSLEVFGSHVNKNEDVVATNLGRKLSMLTWDAIPKSQTLPTSSKNRIMNDDLGSDASSDLFEIENLPGTANVSLSPLLARQASDGGFPQNAPSERSIEWSVVTASAADFSAVWGCDEKDDSKDVKTAFEPTNDTSGSRQSKTGLLGYKNQKAVNVVKTAHRNNTNLKIPRPH